jgi:hypothetical protein
MPEIVPKQNFTTYLADPLANKRQTFSSTYFDVGPFLFSTAGGRGKSRVTLE